MKNKFKLLFIFLLTACFTFLFISCSQSNLSKSKLYPLQKLIKVPEPSDEQKREFNSEIKSEYEKSEQVGGKTISGYRTKNKRFLEEVITPLVTPHLNKLTAMTPTEIINTLTLFGYEIYQTYFGWNFYRWGGDILDLDDPQDRSVRNQFSYGLDCSGLSAMPYELAVYFKLLTSEQTLFSSAGYEKYCKLNNKNDIGGREGTSNNYRLDTPELAELGKVVFSLEKNQVPTEDQIKLLQPGDIVGRSGHFGIIVELNGEPYYLESGGWVVPKNDGIPVKAIDALRIFASSGSISVRRCLDSKE